jgi:hypothetical protein
VEKDRNGWKNRPEGAPTVRCGGSRLHPRGSYFASLLGRSHPPGSYQRAGPHTGQSSAEDPEIQEPPYLARSFSVILSSSAILAIFFYIVYVIGPEVTSPEKTSRLVLGKFFSFVTFHIGAIFLLCFVSSLGRVERRKDPEDLPWIRTA